ncbi:MAG: hypothetical protein JSR85_00965 [Proteobacteria bacterium]|nr:hypothetical protein [Pseudomonadota bacterium]
MGAGRGLPSRDRGSATLDSSPSSSLRGPKDRGNPRKSLLSGLLCRDAISPRNDGSWQIAMGLKICPVLSSGTLGAKTSMTY